ncbi:hypothetical protein BH10PSE19_BH10PSE19_02850 [soil metagenome]
MLLENFFKWFIEISFSLGLFINALLFIPQVIKLYQTKNSQELSLLTFGGFVIIQFLTFLHGYLHRDYLLMVGYFMSLATCGLVVVLIINYRLRRK